MRVSIYDMDGTIVDSSHRYRAIIDENNVERIDLKYWRENEYRAMDDGLLPLANQYMEEVQHPDVFVIIATARVLNAPDWEFITKILGKPDAIVSRLGNTDNRSGKDLKIKGLQKIFNENPHLDVASAVFYEDNIQYLKAVCDHFQMRGVYIPSIQGH